MRLHQSRKAPQRGAHSEAKRWFNECPAELPDGSEWDLKIFSPVESRTIGTERPDCHNSYTAHDVPGVEHIHPVRAIPSRNGHGVEEPEPADAGVRRNFTAHSHPAVSPAPDGGEWNPTILARPIRDGVEDCLRRRIDVDWGVDY